MYFYFYAFILDLYIFQEDLEEEEFDWWSKFYASAVRDEPDSGPVAAPEPEPDTLGMPKV